MTQTVQKQKDQKRVESQRRIILVTGNKGGTGKSTFTRGFRDVLDFRGIECGAYDCDRDNAQLYRFYQGVGSGVDRVDIFARGGADALIDDLEDSRAAVMLVDLPAGSGRALEDFEREVGFVGVTRELGYAVTLVSVLSRVKDSVNALRVLMEGFGQGVEYVAVKNLFFGEGEKFSLFESSKVRGRLAELGGVVIEMPDLFDDTFDLIDQGNLTFRGAAMEGSPLKRSHRSRVYQWLKLFEGQVDLAGQVLGVRE